MEFIFSLKYNSITINIFQTRGKCGIGSGVIRLKDFHFGYILHLYEFNKPAHFKSNDFNQLFNNQFPKKGFIITLNLYNV